MINSESEEVSSKAPAPGSTNWLGVILITLMIVLSIIPRVKHLLHEPILERHGFRQTQTAITVSALLEDGFSLLHAKTPILGPPWEVPMEFPVYQITAAALIKCTHMSTDVGCRVTSLLFFYFSAAMLFCIARHCFRSTGAGLCVLGFYLWSPFTIFWSRTSMIEFAPVAFGLACVYCLLKWFDDPKQWLWVVLGIISCSIAALAKITSLAAMAPVLAAFSLAFLWKEYNSVAPDQRVSLLACRLAVLFLYAMIPLVIGGIWVRYSDHVKSASPLTSWLTSHALSKWNYGTLRQRLVWGNWEVIFGRIFDQIFPYAMMILPVIGVASFFKAGRTVKWLLAGMLVGAIVPIAIFFNLFFIHEYYLCAVTPCLAVIGGYGLYIFGGWLGNRNFFEVIIYVAALAFSWVFAYSSYLSAAYGTNYQNAIVEIGHTLEKVAPPGEYVLVADDDWNSEILYYSDRRGCMLRNDYIRDNARRLLPLNQFTTLASQHADDPALKWYRSSQLLAQTNNFWIYRVTDPISITNASQ